MSSSRDYEAAAAVIRKQVVESVGTVEGMAVVLAFATGMADYYAAENPRFDRARFMKAAGVRA